MLAKVTPHSKGGKHVGYKKMVGGRLIHLINGTSEEHRHRAERIAEALLARWARLQEIGQGWTDDDIAAAFLLAGETPPAKRQVCQDSLSLPRPVLAPVVNAGIDGPLVHDCVDKFKTHAIGRFENGEIDDDSLFLTLQLAEKVKEAMPNKPINTLTKVDLDAMRQHWTKRPHRRGTEKPIAISTVRHMIRTTREILDYCLDYEEWNPPKRWERCFKKLKLNKLRTLLERKVAKAKKPNFDIDDLQMLWHQSVPLERLFLGLGLFAGHGSEEIATLLKLDVVVETDGVYIDRLRHKTGVHGRWWLPPEVSDLLLKQMANTPDNPAGLALLGKRGKPLVHRGIGQRKHKTDVVSQAWTRVRRRCAAYDIRLFSFKYLRKTGSQWVRNRLGLKYSEVFLAHGEETVAEENYNDPMFEKLAVAMKAIHAQKKKMFAKINWEEWKTRQKSTPSPQAA